MEINGKKRKNEEMKVIRLEKSRILGKIYLKSGYVAGKQTDDLVNFDRISAIEEDSEFLLDLIEGVAVELAAMFGPNLERFESRKDSYGDTGNSGASTGDLVQLSVRIRSNAEVVEGLAIEYVAAETLARWLEAVGESAMAAAAAVNSKSRLELLKEMIERPVSYGCIASPRRVEVI